MDEVYNAIINRMPQNIQEKFLILPEEIIHLYLRFSGEYLDELFARDIIKEYNRITMYNLFGIIIATHMNDNITITTAVARAEPEIKMIARELYRRFSPIKTKYKKLERKRIAAEKKMRKKMKKKLEKQAKEEGKRAKAAAKKAIEKASKRTRNTFCKNDIEFITQEDIEDIPTEDLSFIKLEKSIVCLDKDSFKNMVKFAKGQKVRGACKPAIPGKPLDCKWFYPINIGNNVYISEENYKNIDLDKRMFSLKNRRMVDFTTGLHIMSEKSGLDAVYDLVVDKYDIKEEKKKIAKKIKKSMEKEKKSIKKSFRKMKLAVKDIKKICKKKGIKGYSKWKKAELEKRCLDKEQVKKQAKKSMTVKQLKTECKRKGIRGYSKLKKAELEKKCLS